MITYHLCRCCYMFIIIYITNQKNEPCIVLFIEWQTIVYCTFLLSLFLINIFMPLDLQYILQLLSKMHCVLSVQVSIHPGSYWPDVQWTTLSSKFYFFGSYSPALGGKFTPFRHLYFLIELGKASPCKWWWGS